MLSKMSINALAMSLEDAKRGYVQCRVDGHALAQLKPRLRPSTANSFQTSDKMLEVQR